jgi:hypothetical protein
VFNGHFFPSNVAHPNRHGGLLITCPHADLRFSSTQCGWQWAYEELPELSALFDDAVKVSIPNSSSRASAYGENCLDNDGQVVYFLTMETDFHVTVPVETLDDYNTFGNWIAQVMQVVDGLPSNLIEGPQPGFVEFRFENGSSEFIILRVPIQEYNESANGKTGVELFRSKCFNPLYEE